MPTEATPASLEALAEALRDCGNRKQVIELGGNFTKRAMGGTIHPADAVLSTRALTRILAYEPKDLTISVEAGLTFRELNETLKAQGQMLPLDPPFSENATIGGVIATNSSGPRRRRYGTARDMVIGMTMITLEGKAVQSGGMVVKNVTGLDMAKLMIGSFGTLGAIGSINFKVFPQPETGRTFVCPSDSLDTVLTLRHAILGSVLQPAAVDLLNPEAVAHIGCGLPARYSLVLEAAGSRAAVERYQRDYEARAKENGLAEFLSLPDEQAAKVWGSIRNFSPGWLERNGEGSVLRVSGTSKRLGEMFRAAVLGHGTPPIVSRAGAAVGYVYCSGINQTGACLRQIREAGFKAVVEHASPAAKGALELWEEAAAPLEIMRRIKQSLDPDHLLNRGRLFNRI